MAHEKSGRPPWANHASCAHGSLAHTPRVTTFLGGCGDRISNFGVEDRWVIKSGAHVARSLRLRVRLRRRSKSSLTAWGEFELQRSFGWFSGDIPWGASVILGVDENALKGAETSVTAVSVIGGSAARLAEHCSLNTVQEF